MKTVNMHLLDDSVCEQIRKEQAEKNESQSSKKDYLPWFLAGGLALLWLAK
ncbi:hypothetical protein [Gracilimonas tropica]|uniref:hypothetical protein n=1 Tax=Gracilimonas tropica TaxID=454600 RepID=UPI0012F997F9|nr:hypothetical protein [Gracilimonas tropica]